MNSSVKKYSGTKIAGTRQRGIRGAVPGLAAAAPVSLETLAERGFFLFLCSEMCEHLKTAENGTKELETVSPSPHP